MLRNRCLFIAFLITGAASGQSLTGGIENQGNLNQIASSGDPTQVVRQYDERYAGVKGSPYLLETFNPGRVKLKSGAKYISSFLNYDCVNDDLVFKKDANAPEMIVRRDLIDSFQLDSSFNCPNNKTIVWLALQGQATGFYELLYGGKNKIYQRVVKKLVKADFKGAYSMGSNYDRFDKEVNTFFVSDKVGQIKLNNKSISALFPNRSSEISSFIKRNKLDVKKPSDLKAIMEFAESLD